jgi:hypothetical protein
MNEAQVPDGGDPMPHKSRRRRYKRDEHDKTLKRLQRIVKLEVMLTSVLLAERLPELHRLFGPS